MTWEGNKSFLQVSAGNQNAGRGGKYKSSLVMALWSQAYADYLAKAKRQCEKLNQKPMGELINSGQKAFAMDCKSP